MPLDATRPSITHVVDNAYQGILARNAERKHEPSDDQLAALYDFLSHMGKAADGTLPPAVHVSAIPAGVGKTTAIAEFTLALLLDPRRSDVGVLIAVNRVAEVRDMALRLAAVSDRLCVVCAPNHTDVLRLGRHSGADSAQVVICTQASLKIAVRASGSFGGADRFHFRGARRAVVAWDEALRFNKPVVVHPPSVLRLAGPIEARYPSAYEALVEWALSVSRAEGVIEVPDFEALGLDFGALLAGMADDEDNQAQVEALSRISGKRAHVHHEGNRHTNLTSIPDVPYDLVPVLVTDASAARGINEAAYEQMGSQTPINFLKAATKQFTNLVIGIVPTGASRSAYRDQSSFKGRDLINMIVDHIHSLAPEEVLLISYKKRMTIKGVAEHTIAKAVETRLAEGERGRVHYLTWGSHTSTNSFTNVPHVILCGLNFTPKAAAYAASGAALGVAMNTNDPSDHPTPQQVKTMDRGSLREDTMQAILRGNARLSQGGDCRPMTVLVPQALPHGLTPEDWENVFPGVQIRDASHLLPSKPLTGKASQLAALVASRFAAGEGALPYPSLYGAMNMDRTNFMNRLLKGDAWKDHATARGYQAVRLKGGVLALRQA